MTMKQCQVNSRDIDSDVFEVLSKQGLQVKKKKVVVEFVLVSTSLYHLRLYKLPEKCLSIPLLKHLRIQRYKSLSITVNLFTWRLIVKEEI